MEYMFILSKGRPKSVNLIKDKSNKGFGRKITGNIKNQAGKSVKKHGAINSKTVAKFGTRDNVWLQDTARGRQKYSHPAQFPEKLAHDHIISWSNEGDIVLDPFMGSGTTGVVCKNLNRNFIGIELDESYYNIAKDRINSIQPTLL